MASTFMTFSRGFGGTNVSVVSYAAKARFASFLPADQGLEAKGPRIQVE